MKKNLSILFSIIILSAAIGLSVRFVFAQIGWYEPTNTPPEDNEIPLWIKNGNDLYHTTNGNVGLGIISSASRLHIKDGQSWGSDLSIDAGGTTGGRRWLLVSTGGNAAEGQGKFLIKDNNANAVRLTIDTSGNVNIPGTLTVGSCSGCSSAVTWASITNKPAGFDDNTDNDTTYSAGSGISISNNTITNTGDLSDTNELQTLQSVINRGATANTTSNPMYLSYLSFNSAYDDNALRISYENHNAGSTKSALRIDNYSSGYTFFAGDTINDSTPFIINNVGNVGIGTTSPGYKLDVQGGNINTSGNLLASGVLTVSGTGNSSIAGNVGIGTTNPGAKLDVAGDINLRAGIKSTLPKAGARGNCGTYTLESNTKKIPYKISCGTTYRGGSYVAKAYNTKKPGCTLTCTGSAGGGYGSGSAEIDLNTCADALAPFSGLGDMVIVTSGDNTACRNSQNNVYWQEGVQLKVSY